MGHIDDSRDAGHNARQQIHQADSVLDRDAGKPRAAGAEADRIQRPTDDRSMQQNGIRGQHKEKDRQLGRNDPADIPLAEREKCRRKPAVVHRRFGNPFGHAAKERERAERHDERRELQPRNQHSVEPAAESPHREGDEHRDWNWEVQIAPRGAKAHGRKPHDGADR